MRRPSPFSGDLPRALRAAVAALALPLALLLAVPPAGALALRQIDLARTPPADPAAETAWTRFEMPIRWTSDGTSAERPVRLRLPFRLLSTPARPWSLAIAGMSEGGSVRVNGDFIGAVPQASAEVAVSWRRPHIFAVEPSLLRAGDNEVTIDTVVRPGSHRVSSVDVGPSDEIWDDYSFALLRDYLWIWIALTVAFAMASAGLAARLLRRMPGSLLLAGAGLAWLVHCAAQLFEVVPAPALVFVRAFEAAGLGAFAAFVSASLLRQCGLRTLSTDLVAAALAVAGPLAMALPAVPGEGMAPRLWHLFLALGLGLATSAAIVQRSRGHLSPRGPVLATALLVSLAALVDAALGMGLLGGEASTFLEFAVPPMLMVLAVPLGEGISDILEAAETSRDELELRVREREQLLKRNFERLRESERIKVEAKERQRIMQDMHDGLGSQLMSSLMLVERGAVSNDQFAQILRESIDDMRLAIDALSAEEVDLGAALGNLRYRMEPRLRAAGIELQWDARRLPDDIDIHPDTVLPILRVVQEALTNALKHSRAKTVGVSVGIELVAEESWLTIRVSDSGRGISGERVGGRGLQNMRTRAQKIGAQLRLETARGAGTTVHLRYRVARAPASTKPGTTVLNTAAVIERFREGYENSSSPPLSPRERGRG